MSSRSDPIDLLRRIGGSIMEITDLLTDVDLGRRPDLHDLKVLRVAAHGHVQVIRGMCSDERPWHEIDQALVRLDDVIYPGDHA